MDDNNNELNTLLLSDPMRWVERHGVVKEKIVWLQLQNTWLTVQISLFLFSHASGRYTQITTGEKQYHPLLVLMLYAF